ncbi:L-histidine N(alpha)-methyltransferase [Algoriphagus jejuensis]|uniref:L-histidine N(Alpha)-methyltransferase n=1 Tax=Algoriphagus jejuensis TaxID=419934 RepID=A0ABP3YFK6_9BACT
MSDTQLFKEEVLAGLRSTPKRLPSKYFYDEAGSLIFQEIMDMPEYYLPAAEFEIIQTRSEEIAKRINASQLDIIELGAGDGRKMVHFVDVLCQHVPCLSYFPLDISDSILTINEQLIRSEVPKVKYRSLAGDYFHTLRELEDRTNQRLIVFAGSNIGNYRTTEAIAFLKFIKGEMKPGDFLLLGVDLKKNPKKILPAYNDPQGITRRFNLNLLTRINRELGGDFELNSFDHYATYHPISGAAESFIVSLKKQTVRIGSEIVKFEKDEIIQTEISQKYDLTLLKQLSTAAGIALDSFYSDQKDLFSWVLFRS